MTLRLHLGTKLNFAAKLAVLLLSLATASFAAASGSPETVLAGINIQTTTIPDIQKMYGPQESVFAVPPDPYPPGTKLYKWGRLTLTLKVLTEPSASGEKISVIQIEGEGAPGNLPINKTGRGLRLGAKAREIKKLYGVEAANGSATIHWNDGTTLVIGVNAKGRVNKLELRVPRSVHASTSRVREFSNPAAAKTDLIRFGIIDYCV